MEYKNYDKKVNTESELSEISPDRSTEESGLKVNKNKNNYYLSIETGNSSKSYINLT
jgi:hypothetical protein